MKVSSFLMVFGALLLCACQSMNHQIHSSPSDAEVEILFKNGNHKNLGKTPVTIVSQELNPNQESLQVKISKVGYDPMIVFVPASSFEKNVQINASLNESARNKEGKKNEAVYNDIAAQVAEIQKNIQKREFDVAETALSRMITAYPGVSTFYSLQGNVNYLEKRFDRALSFYRKALELDPNSSELARIVDKLESITKGTSI